MICKICQEVVCDDDCKNKDNRRRQSLIVNHLKSVIREIEKGEIEVTTIGEQNHTYRTDFSVIKSTNETTLTIEYRKL